MNSIKRLYRKDQSNGDENGDLVARNPKSKYNF